MPISVTCPNGHRLKAKDEHAGRSLACPECRSAVVVPTAEADIFTDLDPSDLQLAEAAAPTSPLVRCPDCGEQLNFQQRAIGNTLVCPRCNQPLLTVVETKPADPTTGLTLGQEPASAVAEPRHDLRMKLAIAGFGAGVGMFLVALSTFVVLLLRSPGDDRTIEAPQPSVVAPAASDQNEPARDAVVAQEPAQASKNEQPKPNNPTSSPAALQVASARQSDWRKVQEAGRRSRSWLYVNVTPRADGSRTARVRGDEGDGQFPERPLAEGEGVPLFECNSFTLEYRGWANPATQPATDAERKVLQNTRETDIYRICKLSDFATGSFDRGDDGAQNFDHRHVWSPDGKYLYVLSGQQRSNPKQRLRKVNTQTWEVELELQPSEEIVDFAWTAQGLVVICDQLLRDWRKFDDGETWVRLYPSNQQLQNYKGGVFLLDPDTLNTRRGWVTPRVQEVAGHAGSDLIYLRNPQDALLTINVKTGELLSCYSYHDLLGDDWDTAIRDDLHFLHPQLSADGRSLTTHGMNNSVSTKRVATNSLGPRSVNRFRVAGPRIEWEQCKRVGGIRSRFTRRCDVGVGEDYLCLPDRRFEIVPADVITEPVAKLSLPPDAAVVVDSPSKTIFLCWPDWPAKQLTFRMIRGPTDTEVTLNDGIVPTTKPTSFRDTSFPKESLVHHNLWPFEMSAAPDGRGAIVFTPDAAYWIEPKFGGATQWAFNESPGGATAAGAETVADATRQEDQRSATARQWAEKLTKCKAATALILVPSQGKFGSAFCIDEQGYFLTNAFHVEGLEVDSEVSLVVQAGSFHERATKATIARIDPKARVALLKTEPHADLVPLQLGDDKRLTEAAPLTAFGYTRIPEHETSVGRYPSVGVKPGVATALRRTAGDLVAIQFNGVLLPGNSGGPVVDATGDVVGVALSGIEVLGLNFLIPATQLRQLEWPELRRDPQIVQDRPGMEQRSLTALAKDATALVVLPDQKGFGTAFCVDKSGYFATNAHVVEGISDADVITLVLHSAEARQQLVSAKVVRTMSESDLALLKLVDQQDDLTALEIDDSTTLAEQMEVRALGFPFADALAVSGQQFPSVSVNVARIEAVTTTTLGHEAFEFLTQLNPGNSGGPVVSSEGKVVGVVFATQLGARKSYAIPAARLRELMFNPSFDWKVLAVEYADRRKETVFPVVATPYLRSLDGLELSVSLKPEYGPEKVYPLTAKDTPGTYEVRAPLIAAEVPDYVKATFDFTTGSITGITADHQVKVGERSFRLSTAPEGAFLGEQRISGLEQVVVDTSQGKPTIDCSRAIGATFAPYRPSFVTYTIIAHQDGRELVRHSGKIDVSIRVVAEERTHRFEKQFVRAWSESPSQQGLPPLKVTAKFEGGSITGLAAPRRFKVIRFPLPEEYDLSEVKSIKVPPLPKDKPVGNVVRQYQLNLTGDGRMLNRVSSGSQLQGLEQVPIRVGASEVLVDLTAAHYVRVEPLNAANVQKFPLFSPIGDVAAGGKGRWLILRLPELGRLVVFDVPARRVVHQIPLAEDNVLFAAGAEKLLVVFPGLEAIERWDLASGRHEMTAEFLHSGTIGAVAMGCGGPGPMLMHGYDSADPPKPFWMLVDTQSLKTSRLEARLPESSYPKPPPLTSSVEGTVFGSLDLALVLKGKAVEEVSLSAKSEFSASIRYAPFLVTPGASGQRLFYRHSIYSTKGEVLGGGARFYNGIPTYDEEYYLSFHYANAPSGRVPQVTICQNKAATLRPLVILDTMPFKSVVNPQDGKLPLRKRCHFYPDLRLLVSIPLSDDVLLLNELPAWK